MAGTFGGGGGGSFNGGTDQVNAGGVNSGAGQVVLKWTPATVGGPYAAIVGQPARMSGSAADGDGDSIASYSWTATPETGTSGSCSFGDSSQAATTVSCTAAGSYDLVLSATDSTAFSGQSSAATLHVLDIGDVNGDLKVDAKDALCVLRLVDGLPNPRACPQPPPGNPDVNQDASADGTAGTDVVDALCLLRHIAGLPSTGACPAWGSQPSGTASRESAVGGRVNRVPAQAAAAGAGSVRLSLSPAGLRLPWGSREP